jgi:hypothetical protein
MKENIYIYIYTLTAVAFFFILVFNLQSEVGQKTQAVLLLIEGVNIQQYRAFPDSELLISSLFSTKNFFRQTKKTKLI